MFFAVYAVKGTCRIVRQSRFNPPKENMLFFPKLNNRGVTIGHRKGDARIDPEKALLECYKVLGSMRFAQAITVSPKLKEIWERFTSEPFPLEIERGPDIYFPKLAQPKCRGKARQLRNKRTKELSR
jgi:hypothetical protein